MELKRRMVAIGDVELETFTGGSGGPTICTAHGFVVTTKDGGLATNALATIAETVSINVRSLGESTAAADPASLSMEQAVRDIEAVRTALGYDRWVFAGGSAGGFLGLHYALMFPESLQALILVGTAASSRSVGDPTSIYHPDHPHNAQMREVDGTQEWPEVVWPLISRERGPVIEAARQSGGISIDRLGALQAELPDYDLEPRLKEIAIPTLVIHGRHDSAMPVSQGEVLGSGIPDSELVIIEESGHFPFWERPREFDEAVRRFVERIVA